MLKHVMAVSKEKNPDYSRDFSVLSKVNQNNCVLEAAQKYLNLRDGLNKGVLQHDELAPKVSLPADLMAVEQGISVLCNAYKSAMETKQTDVCANIEKELNEISDFYFEKVSEAYFSAGNILLNAQGEEEAESGVEALAKNDEIKPLAESYKSLKNMYAGWPVTEPMTECKKTDLSKFLKVVEAFNVGNSMASSKKVGKTKVADYRNLSSLQRVM